MFTSINRSETWPRIKKCPSTSTGTGLELKKQQQQQQTARSPDPYLNVDLVRRALRYPVEMTELKTCPHLHAA